MWRFKPFAHKEQTGLEGRIIDIGNFKVQVRNAIAEGGFSCVYLARDVVQGSKQYALKHIICNDEESQELVTKEISVMKILKGHPKSNVVTLHAHAIFDMGRTKEALLLMKYCEKSLVNALESRGAGFFEEKQGWRPEAEVEKLKDQLASVSAEKAEITSKYEKLSAICRSQRQEIQDLKHAVATRTSSHSGDSARGLASPGSQSSIIPPNEKIEGTVWELQQGFFDQSSPSPDSKQWQAFAENPKPEALPTYNTSKSVRTRNGQQNKQAAELTSSANSWGFGTDSFKVVPAAGSKVNVPIGELNNSQRFGESKSTESKLDSQPAGWAGF